MRTFFVLFTLCAAIAARAQTAPTASTTTDQNAHRLTPPSPNLSLIYTRPLRPNEVRFDRVSCDGILVHFAKRENQLQLINPVAPPPYTSMDNVVSDPITKKVTGWKLFSISF